jgi:hypothetical protein
MAQFECGTLKTQVAAWADFQDEPKVDVHDVALIVQHDVAVVPIFGLTHKENHTPTTGTSAVRIHEAHARSKRVQHDVAKRRDRPGPDTRHRHTRLGHEAQICCRWQACAVTRHNFWDDLQHTSWRLSCSCCAVGRKQQWRCHANNICGKFAPHSSPACRSGSRWNRPLKTLRSRHTQTHL